jgi:nicotinamidase/pyrazinamidase
MSLRLLGECVKAYNAIEMSTQALLVVDLQNDFCPGGALAVPQGDQVIPVLNRSSDLFAQAKLPIFASRDWHPPKTKHFALYGGTWPIHCVQGTSGAAFHPALELPANVTILSKGMDPNEDCYSCFEATAQDGTPLLDVLRREGIQELFIGGLATDYCVKATVLDARKHGLDITVLSDAIRGVDLTPGDVERALREMKTAGARFVRLDAVSQRLSGAVQ